MNYNKAFSHSVIGYITTLVEPVDIDTPVDYVKNEFLQNSNLTAIPVSSHKKIVGIIEKSVLLNKNRKLYSILHPTIKNYYNNDFLALKAREDATQALEDILRASKDLIRHCIIYFKGNYYGIVNTMDLMKHIQNLKSKALIDAQYIQNHLNGPAEINEPSFSAQINITMAHELGGDFHHFDRIGESAYLLSFFDVSGKDIGAALITGLISGFFSTLNHTGHFTTKNPREIIETLHKIIEERTPDDIFIAGILIFFNEETKKITIYNLGYSPVYVIKKADTPEITIHNPDFPPFGFPTFNFDSAPPVTLTAEEGLIIFGSSDGLADAHDIHGKTFGFERIRQSIKQALLDQDERLVETMKKKIRKFIGKSPQTDDITIFQLSFKDKKEEQ